MILRSPSKTLFLAFAAVDVLGFCGVTETIESKPPLLALRVEDWEGLSGGWCAGCLLRNFLEMVLVEDNGNKADREESYCGACPVAPQPLLQTL